MKYKWKCEWKSKDGCYGTKFFTTNKRAESYERRLLALNGHPALSEEDTIVETRILEVDESDNRYLDMLNMGV